MRITKKTYDNFSAIFESIEMEAKEKDLSKPDAEQLTDKDTAQKSSKSKDDSATIAKKTEKDEPLVPQDQDTKDVTDDIIDVDVIMKKPAGVAKIIAGINAKAMASVLKLPLEQQASFKSAVSTLTQKEPKLSPAQSMALATALARMQKRLKPHLPKIRKD